MTTASIKKRLHEYIDTATDKKLKAIYILLENDIIKNQLVKYSTTDNNTVELTEEQIQMLKLSDRDIVEGRLIQEQIDKNNIE